MKHCPKCNTTKPTTEFYTKRLPNGKTTTRSYCKACGKADRDAWRKSSPKDNERNKQYNKTNAQEIRGKKLVKNYWPNLTWQEAVAEWDRMFILQNGLCAFGHKTPKLHVDHCHVTGAVRGLLCYNCNNGLGRFKDSIKTLQKAIEYLKKHE